MHCWGYNPGFLPGRFQVSRALPQHKGEDPRTARITACVKAEDLSGFKSNPPTPTDPGPKRGPHIWVTAQSLISWCPGFALPSGKTESRNCWLSLLPGSDSPSGPA